MAKGEHVGIYPSTRGARNGVAPGRVLPRGGDRIGGQKARKFDFIHGNMRNSLGMKSSNHLFGRIALLAAQQHPEGGGVEDGIANDSWFEDGETGLVEEKYLGGGLAC